jgi:hypothetical protein
METHREPSLMRGGLFHQALKWTKIAGPNEQNLVRRITFAIALGWIPLVLITAIFNRDGLGSLFRDYTTNARMLIAIPVLLVGQAFMESRFRLIMNHILDSHLLEGPEMGSLEQILTGMTRLRDSLIPELIILLLVVSRTAITFKSQVADIPWIASIIASDFHLTPAGWYAALVSASLFQFLIGLGLWKWLLWTIFAFRFSRLRLNTVPIHPDQHGGLGFLTITPVGFAPIAIAATTIIGAVWRHQILSRGAHLMDFKMPAIVLVVIVVILAFGPLLFFVPQLTDLRRKGILEYAILGQLHSLDFHEKWIRHRAGHESELLAAPEISSLCDFGQFYDRIEGLKPLVVDRGVLGVLVLAVAVPVLPAVLAEVPITVIVKDLFAALK